jgi:hypothetical protein
LAVVVKPAFFIINYVVIRQIRLFVGSVDCEAICSGSVRTLAPCQAKGTEAAKRRKPNTCMG